MSILRSQRGLTIFELLVSMSLAATFGTAALQFYRAELHSLQDHSAALAATDKVRSTMAFVTREIRRTGYDPKLTALVVPGYKGIRSAGPNYLWIVFDQDDDGGIDYDAVDPTAESVIYTYDSENQQILRTVAGVSQPLAKNVPPGTLAFQYYDLLGNELPFDTAPVVPLPAGHPSLPAPVSGAITAATLAGTSLQNRMLSAANRELVALVRLNLQVQITGTFLAPAPPATLKLSQRITVPARILDRL
ncbi:MAG: PilW family protein [Candidatus Binatia bacterium]